MWRRARSRLCSRLQVAAFAETNTNEFEETEAGADSSRIRQVSPSFARIPSYYAELRIYDYHLYWTMTGSKARRVALEARPRADCDLRLRPPDSSMC
jgi:hypothetical protein